MKAPVTGAFLFGVFLSDSIRSLHRLRRACFFRRRGGFIRPCQINRIRCRCLCVDIFFPS